MREPNRDKGRLQDIIQAADNVISFTEGFSMEELLSDKLRYLAVVKNVEIIGEASYMLSSEFKESHSEIPWKGYYQDATRTRSWICSRVAGIIMADSFRRCP